MHLYTHTHFVLFYVLIMQKIKEYHVEQNRNNYLPFTIIYFSLFIIYNVKPYRFNILVKFLSNTYFKNQRKSL